MVCLYRMVCICLHSIGCYLMVCLYRMLCICLHSIGCYLMVCLYRMLCICLHSIGCYLMVCLYRMLCICLHSIGCYLMVCLYRMLCICLHSIECYLMVCLYRMGKKQPQLIYLASLSCCEALCNILRFLSTLITGVILVDEESNTTGTIQHYFDIALSTGMNVIYYFSIIIVIFDRFLGIFLSLKYKVYCTTFKAKVVVSTLWMIGFALIFSLLLIDVLLKLYIDLGISWCIYPCFDLSVIVLSSLTYSYIFKIYKSSQSSTTVSTTQSSSPSANLVKNSKFFIPFLLTISFVVFIAVPNFLYFFIIEIKENKAPVLLDAAFVCYLLSDLVGAFIYILYYTILYIYYTSFTAKITLEETSDVP